MADKNGRERLSMYFNTKNEKEMELWDYIKDKYSKSAFVKEAIEEKMFRELNGEKTLEKKLEKSTMQTNEIIKEPTKIKLNNDDKKSLDNLAGGF